MAELTIRPEEIREALDRYLQSYTPDTSAREEVGTVVTSGDGIARSRPADGTAVDGCVAATDDGPSRRVIPSAWFR